MSVSGSLETMPVPEILQWLGHNDRTGTLRIERSGHSTSVSFVDGRIVACISDEPTSLLGQFLVFQGIISPERLRQVLGEQERTGEGITDALVRSGGATPGDIEAAVAAKAEQTILALFDGDGAFSFDAKAQPHPKAARLSLGVQDLLLRGMKRLDDARRIAEAFGSAESVPARTDRPLPAHLVQDGPSRRIAAAVDGRRTVKEIALLVHGSEFQVASRLFDLLEADLVRIVHTAAPIEVATVEEEIAPEAAMERASGLVAGGSWEPALELLTVALRRRPEHEALRRRTAETEAAYCREILRRDLPPRSTPVPILDRERIDRLDLSAEERLLIHLTADGSWDVKGILDVAPVRGILALRALKRLLDLGAIEVRRAAPAEGTAAPRC